MPQFLYDPWMIRSRSFDEVCRFAAEMGYAGIELSPRDDFLPLFAPPIANRDSIAALKRSLAAYNIELFSMWTVYRWADPGNSEDRKVAVSHFRRFIEVAGELDCPHISSEFGGMWQNAQECEEAFLLSIEDLLPYLERSGITLGLDPHPGDWIEDGRQAVEVLDRLGIPNLRLLYSAPHSFYLDANNDVGAFIREIGSRISFVRVADTFDHRPLVRYIVNPLGAEVRIHQHLNIGEGEIDWTQVFDALTAIGYRGCISNSVFAWPDRVAESAKLMLIKMQELCAAAAG